MALTIRSATPGDCAAIAAIYDHHARHGTATFDLEGPPASAWALKIADVGDRRWPFLVAESDGVVVGYAYATQFRDRPAYVHACESSIYVAADQVGQGIGSALLLALKDAARSVGFDQMIAVVTASTLIAYVFYTISPETEQKFNTHWLGLTVPFPLYGIFRYLYLVHQREGGGSPAELLLTDRPLLVCVTLWALAVVLIIYHPI